MNETTPESRRQRFAPDVRIAWAAIASVVAVAAISAALVLRQPRPSTLGPALSAGRAQPAFPPPSTTAAGVPSAPGANLELGVAGRIRVLFLHASDPPADQALSRDLLAGFARERGVEALWIPVATRAELVAALRSGRGDVTVDELALENDTDGGLLRTAPVSSERYVVLGRPEAVRSRSTRDFIDRRVAVQPGSPVWPVLARLAEAYPGIRLLPQSDAIDARTLVTGIPRGDWDFVVGPWKALSPHVTRGADLDVAFDLTPDRPVAWTTRATAPRLRQALDDYLHRSALFEFGAVPYAEDLAGIRARGVLRVVTWRDARNFYLDRGDPRGFEYEMAARFAAHERLRLSLTVVDSTGAMIAALVDGRADLVLARAAARSADHNPMLAASRSYHYVAPVLMTRAGSPRDGTGARAVIVEAGWVETAPSAAPERGAGRVTRFQIDPQRALRAVIAGVYDGAVIDAGLVPGVLETRPQLRAGKTVSVPQSYRWTMRAGDVHLRGAVDRFLRAEYGSAGFNELRARYFDSAAVARAYARSLDAPISPYDALARRYADEYGFDWRLLVAQMFTESRFDPRATSQAGAAGLMQVLPQTARTLGYRDLSDPAKSIRAGVHYLDTLRQRFEPELPIAERTWFALAAYHAGYDRVRRARTTAQALGLNPNRWFDQVELAMARRARLDPSLRSTIAYVREIRACYDAYRQYTPAARLASAVALRATDS